MLGGLPWFAWIALVGILVWGALQALELLTGRTLPGETLKEEVRELKERLDAIEGRPAAGELDGGAARGGSALEHRIERLEARADRREAREKDRQEWDRRADGIG